MKTFRELLGESLFSKLKNKIKNYSSENIEVGRYTYKDKDNNIFLPKEVFEVIEYNKGDDIIKLKNVDTNKITELSFKEFWKNTWTNLDYLGEEPGSGIKVYRFWQEVLKTKEYNIPKGSKIFVETDNIGSTKVLKATKVKNIKMISFIEASAITDDLEKIKFNPFDIIK